MGNEEVMEVEVVDAEVVEMESENSGLSTAGAMAVGALLTAAVVGVVKLGKKAWAKYKAHKELRKPDHDVEASDEDIVEFTK
jgi:hypothetical protein